MRSRLSGNSASSEDQSGSKTDTSSNHEGEKITETPPKRLSGVPRLKRENAFIVTDFPARKKSLMFTPEEDSYLKAGIERHSHTEFCEELRNTDTLVSLYNSKLYCKINIGEARFQTSIIVTQVSHRTANFIP